MGSSPVRVRCACFHPPAVDSGRVAHWQRPPPRATPRPLFAPRPSARATICACADAALRSLRSRTRPQLDVPPVLLGYHWASPRPPCVAISLSLRPRLAPLPPPDEERVSGEADDVARHARRRATAPHHWGAGRNVALHVALRALRTTGAAGPAVRGGELTPGRGALYQAPCKPFTASGTPADRCHPLHPRVAPGGSRRWRRSRSAAAALCARWPSTPTASARCCRATSRRRGSRRASVTQLRRCRRGRGYG